MIHRELFVPDNTPTADTIDHCISPEYLLLHSLNHFDHLLSVLLLFTKGHCILLLFLRENKGGKRRERKKQTMLNARLVF